jgi:hypothetical protein
VLEKRYTKIGFGKMDLEQGQCNYSKHCYAFLYKKKKYRYAFKYLLFLRLA